MQPTSSLLEQGGRRVTARPPILIALLADRGPLARCWELVGDEGLNLGEYIEQA
jgi:hypothetical protein